MNTLTEAATTFRQPPPKHEEIMDELEIARVNAEFSEIVRDLALDPEVAQDDNKQAVLGLVADCWEATKEMGEAEVATERDWLTHVVLRAVGAQSGFVRDRGLVEYQDTDAEPETFGPIFVKFEGTEMSTTLREMLPSIIGEFGLAEKFAPELIEKVVSEVRFAVVPTDAPERGALKGAGEHVRLPEGRSGIVVAETTLRGAAEENALSSKSLIAHELAHAVMDLQIGEGDYPLGSLFDELFAEWVGHDKGMYYDEKHMAKLLRVTGLDIRGEILPEYASAKISKAEIVEKLKTEVGSRNALRLLGYMPAVYKMPGREEPAAIVEDCIAYNAAKNGVSPPDLAQNLTELYSPEIASIMVTNEGIRTMIPPSLYPKMLEIARQHPGFDEHGQR